MADTAQTLPKRMGAKFSFPILALMLASLFWSGNFIAGRALRGLIDPLTLNFARWALALVLMGPFVWRDVVASMPVLRREWRLILALGATGIAAFHVLVYFALQRTTATNALLILALAPAATVTGAAALRIEPLRPIQFFGNQLSGSLIPCCSGAVRRIFRKPLRSAQASSRHSYCWRLFYFFSRRRRLRSCRRASCSCALHTWRCSLPPSASCSGRTACRNSVQHVPANLCS